MKHLTNLCTSSSNTLDVITDFPKKTKHFPYVCPRCPHDICSYKIMKISETMLYYLTLNITLSHKPLALLCRDGSLSSLGAGRTHA